MYSLANFTLIAGDKKQEETDQEKERVELMEEGRSLLIDLDVFQKGMPAPTGIVATWHKSSEDGEEKENVTGDDAEVEQRTR